MTDEQIKELFGVVPYFADTVIAPLSCESMKNQFKASLTWSFNGSINIQRVVGTMHPDYAGLTWREMLEKGRRMYNNIKLYKQKTEYYTTFHESRFPSMSFFTMEKGMLPKMVIIEHALHDFFFILKKSISFMESMFMNNIQI